MTILFTEVEDALTTQGIVKFYQGRNTTDIFVLALLKYLVIQFFLKNIISNSY